MSITEKDLDRYYAVKLMESFRNVFGSKDEKFEPHSEDIEKENLKQGYDKTPKRPIDVCDRELREGKR